MGRILLVVVISAALCGAASAQAASLSPPVMVPLSGSERSFLLQMCEAAKYASRMTYEVACEQLKAKFAEAEKATAAPVTAPPPAVTPAPKK